MGLKSERATGPIGELLGGFQAEPDDKITGDAACEERPNRSCLQRPGFALSLFTRNISAWYAWQTSGDHRRCRPPRRWRGWLAHHGGRIGTLRGDRREVRRRCGCGLPPLAATAGLIFLSREGTLRLLARSTFWVGWTDDQIRDINGHQVPFPQPSTLTFLGFDQFLTPTAQAGSLLRSPPLLDRAQQGRETYRFANELALTAPSAKRVLSVGRNRLSACPSACVPSCDDEIRVTLALEVARPVTGSVGLRASAKGGAIVVKVLRIVGVGTEP